VKAGGAEQLRLKIVKASAPPMIAEFSVFAEPA
jgi:hypothetical protein